MDSNLPEVFIPVTTKPAQIWPSGVGSSSISVEPRIASDPVSSTLNQAKTTHEKGNRLARPSAWSRLALDTWTWEISGAVLSLTSVLSIVGVLFAYDQKAAPQLPKGITLNAVIAFLGTIAKTSLLTIVASSISQSKWLWLRSSSRKLDGLQIIDNASHGPLGSLKMLKERGTSTSALLGAIATIFLFGFDPFIQQLLVFPIRMVSMESVHASLPAPSTYDYSPTSGSDVYLAALTGTFGNPSSLPTQVVCPGGNCVWPSYHALALCSRCEDMTKEVSATGDVYDVNITRTAAWALGYNTSIQTGPLLRLNTLLNYTTMYSFGAGAPANISVQLEVQTLPDLDQFMEFYSHKTIWTSNLGDISTNNWANIWSRLNLAGVDGPLLGFNYIDVDSPDCSRLTVAKAYECVLTPCVHEYRSSMTGGRLSSEILSTDYGYVLDAPNDVNGSNWTAIVNGTTFYITDRGLPGSASAFVISGWVSILVRFLYSALVSTATFQCSGYCEPTDGLIECFVTDSEPLIWSSTSAEVIDLSSNSFPQILENIAASVTNLFQQYSTRNVTGTALQAQAHVEVRWVWLTYPLILLLLGIASLALTIIGTKRNGMVVWKSSLLPLLCRQAGQLNAWDVDASVENNRISHIDAMSKNWSIRLGESDNASGLWLLEKTKVEIEREEAKN